MTTTAVEQDLVDLLLAQHSQIRDLFSEVESSTGEQRVDAFNRLVRLLAVHETAEEEIVHPLARRTVDGGNGIVDDRLVEERDAKEQLSAMEKLDPNSAEFAAALAGLRLAVITHAMHEETYEFRYLRQTVKPAQLRALAAAVKTAEATAPTHPHPAVESAKANLAIGPIAAAFDRAKDLLRDATTRDKD